MSFHPKTNSKLANALWIIRQIYWRSTDYRNEWCMLLSFTQWGHLRDSLNAMNRMSISGRLLVRWHRGYIQGLRRHLKPHDRLPLKVTCCVTLTTNCNNNMWSWNHIFLAMKPGWIKNINNKIWHFVCNLKRSHDCFQPIGILFTPHLTFQMFKISAAFTPWQRHF